MILGIRQRERFYVHLYMIVIHDTNHTQDITRGGWDIGESKQGYFIILCGFVKLSDYVAICYVVNIMMARIIIQHRNCLSYSHSHKSNSTGMKSQTKI